MSRRRVVDLFNPPPSAWGLRGDPFLWDELQRAFSKSEPSCSLTAFQEQLKARIDVLVGTNLLSGEDVFVERFDAGGMSSGRVSSAFWLDEAIPPLLARHQAIHQPDPWE